MEVFSESIETEMKSENDEGRREHAQSIVENKRGM